MRNTCTVIGTSWQSHATCGGLTNDVWLAHRDSSPPSGVLSDKKRQPPPGLLMSRGGVAQQIKG
jgi:hypothetical protein